MNNKKPTRTKTPIAQKKAVAKYDKKNSQQIPLKFNKGTDKDILHKLSSKGNVQGYIKSLIRKDSGNTKPSAKTSAKAKAPTKKSEKKK